MVMTKIAIGFVGLILILAAAGRAAPPGQIAPRGQPIRVDSRNLALHRQYRIGKAWQTPPDARSVPENGSMLFG